MRSSRRSRVGSPRGRESWGAGTDAPVAPHPAAAWPLPQCWRINWHCAVVRPPRGPVHAGPEIPGADDHGLRDLALLRELGDALVEQPRRERQPDHEGLLPTSAVGGLARDRRSRRPGARLHRDARDHGCVRLRTYLAHRRRAALRSACDGRSARRRRVARGAERQVSRRALRHPVPGRRQHAH